MYGNADRRVRRSSKRRSQYSKRRQRAGALRSILLLTLSLLARRIVPMRCAVYSRFWLPYLIPIFLPLSLCLSLLSLRFHSLYIAHLIELKAAFAISWCPLLKPVLLALGIILGLNLCNQ